MTEPNILRLPTRCKAQHMVPTEPEVDRPALVGETIAARMDQAPTPPVLDCRLPTVYVTAYIVMFVPQVRDSSTS